MFKIYYLDRRFPNNSFRLRDKKIIEAIIQSIEQKESTDIREIAKKNYSSPSSISRLAKRAGFNNFKEMIFSLSQEISNVKLDKLEALPFVSCTANTDSIDEIFRDTFINRRLYLYGEGFCQFLVSYLYRKLLLKKIYPVDLNGVEINLVSDGFPHTLFIFSQSGENEQGLVKIRECKSNGGTVVAFVASKNSRFVDESDMAFIIDSGVDKLELENQGLNYFYGNCLNLLEYLIKYYR